MADARGALGGLAAAAAGLATALVLRAIVAPRPFFSPVMGALLIASVLVLGMIAGVLEFRQTGWGWVPITTAIAGFGLFIIVIAPGSVIALLPPFVGGGVALGVLTWLRNLGESGVDASRRRLLVGSLGVLGASSAAGVISLKRSPSVPFVPVTSLPRPASPLPALPAGLPAVQPVTPLQTPVDKFYQVDISIGQEPRVSYPNWTLAIVGMVEHELSIGFEELLSMGLEEHDITLACVSNEVGGGLVGGARFTGVRVDKLLARVNPSSGADMVLSRGADGFTAGTPLSVLRDGRPALLAVAMNGKPLTIEHGAPVRLVTPGLFGYVGATKWLNELSVTTFAQSTAFWTVRGWAPEGPIKLQTRIDLPTTESVKAGDITVGGVAWPAHNGIAVVELRVDGGPWRTTTLGPDLGVDYWRQWSTVITLSSGTHTLTARAIDRAGNVQTDAVSDVLPDGATGLETVTLTVH